jgi:nitroreductase
MDAVELLKTRKSIPAAFLGAPAPDRATLDEMLTIAARVPDHGKLAPWRFIVFEGEARAEASRRLGEIFARKNPGADPKKLEDESRKLAMAPLVVAVVSRAGPHVKIPEWEQLMSAGAVCLNMVIAANALGYVSNWLTEWMAFDERAHGIIGVKPGEKIAGFIHIGSTDFPVVERPRPVLSDIVTWRD